MLRRYPYRLDGLLSIMKRLGLTSDHVASIRHGVHPDRLNVIDSNPLKSHCAQYIMAVAAVQGRIDNDTILIDQRLRDSRVADMYRRVELLADDALRDSPAGHPAVVEVVTVDGATIRENVDFARGSRENPITDAELRGKFFELAGRRIGSDRAQQVAELIDRLETVPDVAELMALLG